MNKHSIAREVLFGSLEKDGIAVDSTIIKKANNGNCSALFTIGYEYHNTRKEYDKAMAWHLLSAEKNYYLAQNNIGRLYSDGLGVPIDYDIAMGWFLKAAKQKNETAFKNIGLSFEKGEGVPIDKYKALEWYYKHNKESATLERLYREGYSLSMLDKAKSLDLLLMETNEIVELKKHKDMKDMEERMLLLQDTISSLNIELQEKNNDIDSLSSKIDILIIRFSGEQQENKEKMELLKESVEKGENQVNSLTKINKKLEEELENLKTNSRLDHQESSKAEETYDNSNVMVERFNQLDKKLSDINNNFIQLLISANISQKRDSGRRFSSIASKKKANPSTGKLF